MGTLKMQKNMKENRIREMNVEKNITQSRYNYDYNINRI